MELMLLNYESKNRKDPPTPLIVGISRMPHALDEASREMIKHTVLEALAAFPPLATEAGIQAVQVNFTVAGRQMTVPVIVGDILDKIAAAGNPSLTKEKSSVLTISAPALDESLLGEGDNSDESGEGRHREERLAQLLIRYQASLRQAVANFMVGEGLGVR